MGMALKADVTQACRVNGIEKPVDLVFLSNVTMGDRKLEMEVLRMFSAQIPQFVEMMRNANTSDEIQRVAHTIKGAAKSIGAFKLADLADASESSGILDESGICEEMRNVDSYISELR